MPMLLGRLQALGLQPTMLDPADAAGLIVIDGGRVRFSHLLAEEELPERIVQPASAQPSPHPTNHPRRSDLP